MAMVKSNKYDMVPVIPNRGSKTQLCCVRQGNEVHKKSEAQIQLFLF